MGLVDLNPQSSLTPSESPVSLDPKVNSVKLSLLTYINPLSNRWTILKPGRPFKRASKASKFGEHPSTVLKKAASPSSVAFGESAAANGKVKSGNPSASEASNLRIKD